MTTDSILNLVILGGSKAGGKRIARGMAAGGIETRVYTLESVVSLEKTMLRIQPDLMLMHITLPEDEQQLMLATLGRLSPSTRWIGLSPTNDDLNAIPAFANGARDVVDFKNLPRVVVSIARETNRLEIVRESLNRQRKRSTSKTEQGLPSNAACVDEGILVMVGAQFAEMLGYSSHSELIGTPALDIFVADAKAGIRNLLRAPSGRGEVLPEMITQVLSSDNTPIKAIIVISPAPEIGPQSLIIKINSAKHPAGSAADSKTTAPGTDPSLADENPWIERLGQALQNDEFGLATQTISTLSAADRQAQPHIDILLRAIFNIGGQKQEILPDKFLPVAQAAGLMPEVDRWVLQQTCLILATLDRNKPSPRYFVRITADTLQDPELADWLSRSINNCDHQPDCIALELPEPVIEKDLKTTVMGLRKLKEKGCKICISHFGDTEKSKGIIDIIKPDYVKLKASDVQQLVSNPEASEKLKKLIALASARGILTIAPAVENAAALAALWQCGVNFAQGYYMEEPEIVLASKPALRRSS